MIDLDQRYARPARNYKTNILWASAYVGIPFCENVRKGEHCWSLVAKVFREQLGIEVPAYGDTSANDLAAVAGFIQSDTNTPVWREVKDPQIFDVVVMTGRAKYGNTSRRVATHVGIMINDRELLHIESLTDSVIVPLTHTSVQQRIRNFYRHSKMDAHVSAA